MKSRTVGCGSFCLMALLVVRSGVADNARVVALRIESAPRAMFLGRRPLSVAWRRKGSSAERHSPARSVSSSSGGCVRVLCDASADLLSDPHKSLLKGDFLGFLVHLTNSGKRAATEFEVVD